MVRAPSPLGDKIVVSTVAGAGHKDYPLARIPNNVSYEDVSDQPEAQPNQPVSVPLTFHGGMAYSHYDPTTGGYVENLGWIVNERNVLRPPLKINTVTLTGAANPVQYFFETVAPAGSLTFDATDTAKSTGTTTTISNFTVGSGYLRLLVVGVSSNVSLTDATVTYDGTSLTEVSGGSSTCKLFYLLNPDIGSGDIVLTTSSSGNNVIGATSWFNVNPTTPFGALVTASAIGTTATVTVTTTTGEVVVDNLHTTDDATAATVGADQTQRWNDTQVNRIGAGSSQAGADGGVMSWTLTDSDTWVIAAVPIKPMSSDAVPVLYAIAPEAAEINVYKISLGFGGFAELLNTKTFALTPTQPMGRPAEWNDGSNTEWRVPTGDTTNDIQSLSTVAAGVSNDTWGKGDADARFLRVVKEKLYRTTGTNEVSILANAADPETESNWGDEFYVGDAGTKITDLLELSGISYPLKEDGLYEWDGVGKADKVLDYGRATRNGQGAIYWHGGFMIPTASALWWTRTGKPVGPDSNPNNRANQTSIGTGRYFKQGRWMGLAGFGEYLYGLYVHSFGTEAYLVCGRERGASDAPGWGPIIWHTMDIPTADPNDFHGIFITETSESSATAVQPCLWFADGNNVSYLFLDRDGAPQQARGNIDLEDSGSAVYITSGDLDFGFPAVQKQLRVIEGWADDIADGHDFYFFAGIDGAGISAMSAAVTEDGFFQRFWTQDSADTGRSMVVRVLWIGTSNLTNSNGPHLRDVIIRAVLLPKVTRVWTFFLTARDEQAKTGKLVRSELETYVNDLKKWKLPDGDSFNGVLTDLKLLRADEVRNLTPRNQPPPHYIIRAVVREMVSA